MGLKDIYLTNEPASQGIICDILLEMVANEHAFHKVMFKHLSNGDATLEVKLGHEYNEISHSYKKVFQEILAQKFEGEIKVE